MLGGGFEGDAVAEGVELADVVADLAVDVDAVEVVVAAEVVEAGGGIGEEVPDDDQDGPGEGDEGFEFAAAFDDAPVPFAEEGVGFGGCGGDLAEHAFEASMSLWDAPARVKIWGGRRSTSNYPGAVEAVFESDAGS